MKTFHLHGEPPLYTNTFLLISDAGHAAVIDPAARAEDYQKVLRENNAVLSLILCTHGHYDHVGAAAELKKLYPDVETRCESSDVNGGSVGDKSMFPLPAADRGYEEGETILLDELRFQVWHTPGHTQGSVVLLCGGYFFTGDTVFCESCGRTDLPGGSDAEMLASLRKFAQLPVKEYVQVLPGHEEFSTFGYELQHNPYIRMALQK